MHRIARGLVTTLAVVGLAGWPISVYVVTEVRAEQRFDSCLKDQRAFDTLHALIEKTGEPSTQSSALDVIIPALGTTPQRVLILPPAEGAAPPNLQPYYDILGSRPGC